MYGKKPVDDPLGMMNDETLNYPSQTELSLGNSISMGLSPAFWLVGGILADLIHIKILLSVAMVALFATLLMGSYFAKSGIGLSSLFVFPTSLSAVMMAIPSATATSTWFEKHKATAIGIVYAGGGCGSVLFPLFCGPFLGKYGWWTTFRILTGLVSSGVINTLLVEKRSIPSQENDEDELTAASLTETPFIEQRTFRSTHLKPKEVFNFIFTLIFMVSFISQVFYAFSFCAAVYVCVPLALAMGKDGTVYQDAAPIDPIAAGRLIT
ncbi:Major facilitator superfamily [Trypanosoma melophagium]|uniref:Major facilitator superfamily n=1 Tax=Trypanosoma melophagium TaxID=715481 RepID=UPI003519D956|nr:Major facilitator superfamily [Trypanosoma melophagium]